MVRTTVHVLGLAGRTAEALAVGERYLAEHRPAVPAEAALQLELRHAQYQDRPGAYPVPLPERVLRDPAVDQNVVAALTALEQMPKMWGGQAEIADRALAEAMRVVTKNGRVFEFMMVAELQVVSLGAARPIRGCARSGTGSAGSRAPPRRPSGLGRIGVCGRDRADGQWQV